MKGGGEEEEEEMKKRKGAGADTLSRAWRKNR